MTNHVMTKEIPDKAEWLSRAESIGKCAEEQAAEAENNCRISDELAKMIEDAEIPKLFRPKKFGGYSIDLWTYKEMIRSVARHDAAAAWLTYFYSIHEVWVGHLSPEGREEMFGQGGMVADVVAPLGRVEKDGDQYRLYGEWNFASGVVHSDWIGLGAIGELPDSDGPEYLLVSLPVKDCVMKYNWNTMGLRGTGSNGVKVDGVQVPLHRILPANRLLLTGKPAGGDFDENDPIYRMPFMPLFTMGFPLIALGAAERVVSIFKERTEKRVRAFLGGSNAKDSSSSQRVLAELQIQIFAMEGLVDRYIRHLETWQVEGKPVISNEEKGEMMAIRAQVAKMGAEVATKALLTFGGTAIFSGDPLEKISRDLLALASHGNHLYEDAMAAFGGTMFGKPAHPVW